MQIALKKFSPKRIPTSPGVYCFLDRQGTVLYVGKAANLRERVRAYFSENVPEKVKRLRAEAARLRILPLDSEIAALIKEAEYIKRHRPKYNVLLRDDKNYFFVGFTQETFPRIFVTHQPGKIRNSKFKIQNVEYVGPYVSGRALKSTLRLIRRVFPYCTCLTAHHRTCLAAQLGLDPGFCCKKDATPTRIEQKTYAANISRIKKILTGQSNALKKDLERQLMKAAREQRFEDAAKIRDQLTRLDRILAHRGLLVPFETKETPEPNQALAKLGKLLRMRAFPCRIECYDASVLYGTHAVGAMTVFENGAPDPAGWRLFKMRRRGVPNDPAQIEEMLSRRLAHREWQLPELIIVDGGRAQLTAARRALSRARRAIPVIAIVKGKEKRDRLIVGSTTIPFEKLRGDVSRLLTRIRNETHRFAISYHRSARRKSFLGLG